MSCVFEFRPCEVKEQARDWGRPRRAGLASCRCTILVLEP